VSDGNGVYLFCFARRASLRAVGGPGFDEGSKVLAWPHRDVVAVISHVPVTTWSGPEAETNLADLAWVGPRAMLHEGVVERHVREGPVLPARFGTLFSSLDRLASAIESHYGRIDDFLRYVEDRQEWSVKGLWDRAEAEQRVLASDPRWAALPASSGARYLNERRIRNEVRKELRARVDCAVAEASEELSVLAVEAQTLRTLPPDKSEREKEMVFNWAFLLSHTALEAFRTRAGAFGAAFADIGLSIEVVGPWPPYSFCPTLSDEARP